MFIKLTRTDGTPIWINSTYIVTVEPRKAGGAVVVPIGDGLDYDVMDEPDAVFKMMGEKPVQPKVSRAKTKKTADDEAAAESAKAATASAPGGEDKAKPAAKKTRAKAAKKTAATKSADAGDAEPLPAATELPEEKTPLDLDETSIARLRKLAPRTVKKLYNTLMSQFKTADASVTVKALADNGVITVGADDHISWTIPF
jgi:hypothetical protein